MEHMDLVSGVTLHTNMNNGIEDTMRKADPPLLSDGDLISKISCDPQIPIDDEARSSSSYDSVVVGDEEITSCRSETKENVKQVNGADLSDAIKQINTVAVTVTEAKQGILTAIAYFQLNPTYSECNCIMPLLTIYKVLCETENPCSMRNPLPLDGITGKHKSIVENIQRNVKEEPSESVSFQSNCDHPSDSDWTELKAPSEKHGKTDVDHVDTGNEFKGEFMKWKTPSISGLWKMADAYEKNGDCVDQITDSALNDLSTRPTLDIRMTETNATKSRRGRKSKSKKVKIKGKKTSKHIENINIGKSLVYQNYDTHDYGQDNEDLLETFSDACEYHEEDTSLQEETSPKRRVSKARRKSRPKRESSANEPDGRVLSKTDGRSNPSQPYKCRYCDEVFKIKIVFLKHETGHTGKRPLICKICGQGFFVQSNMNKHMRIHTGERPYLCTICGKSFNQGGILNLHMNTHSGEKNFECNVCGKAFSQPGNMQEHKLLAHSTHRPHVCTVCNKAFLHKSRLVTHYRMHTGEKPFSCELCDKKFAVRHYLNLHMNRHLGKKPHKCETCGESFGSTKVLRDHMRRHTGERPFCCTLCGRTFSQRSSLYNHGRVHKRQETLANVHDVHEQEDMMNVTQ